MIELPASDKLNIPGLIGSFRDVTNSYKFYWFWSLLDIVSMDENPFVSYERVAMHMVDLVWYPLDFYKLSFGKQDSFKGIAEKVSRSITIDDRFNSKPIHTQLIEGLSSKNAASLIGEITTILKKYVGYRFLRSFIPHDLRGIDDQKVNALIKKESNNSHGGDRYPYQIIENGIQLNSRWVNYFRDNRMILLAFTKWHLLRFLQRHNPYVIGLSEKLEKPAFRDLKIARYFWSSYMSVNETRCIYTNNLMKDTDVSLDHFIPWSYVVHDRLWNIIPTSKPINSAKSNILPNLDRYLQDFCELQYKAVIFHMINKTDLSLDDYLPFIDIYGPNLTTLEEFKNNVTNELNANIRAAKNIGFHHSFIYRG